MVETVMRKWHIAVFCGLIVVGAALSQQSAAIPTLGNFAGDVLTGVSSKHGWAGRSVMAAPLDGLIDSLKSDGTTFAYNRAAGVIMESSPAAAVTGCSVTGVAGTATSGTFTSGTTGACSVVITTAVTGLASSWMCTVNNDTTAITLVNQIWRQTASTSTTASLTAVTVTGDVNRFVCIGRS